MAHLQLSVDERLATGGGTARRLRREGRVPGVVYQPGQPSIAFSLPDRELRRVLLGQGGRTSVIDLSVGDAPPRAVVFKEWQIDPVRSTIVHIDFQEVDLTEAYETQVHVVLEGTPIGVRDSGGVLDQSLWEVTVSALPDAMPNQIAADVSALEVGGSIAVGDLVAPEGATIVTEAEYTVASVIAPTTIEEPEEGAELDLEREEGAEPEVVGEEREETDESE